MRDLDRLAAIEGRAAAASKGHWEWDLRGFDTTWTLYGGPYENPDIERPFNAIHPMNLLNTDKREWDSNGEANRMFIANAREDVPFLTVALRDAWAEVDALRSTLASVEWSGAYDRCPSCLASESDGHLPDCALATCLRARRATEETPPTS